MRWSHLSTGWRRRSRKSRGRRRRRCRPTFHHLQGRECSRRCLPSQCVNGASCGSSAPCGPGSPQSTTSGTGQSPERDPGRCLVARCRNFTFYEFSFKNPDFFLPMCKLTQIANSIIVCGKIKLIFPLARLRKLC